MVMLFYPIFQKALRTVPSITLKRKISSKKTMFVDKQKHAANKTFSFESL